MVVASCYQCACVLFLTVACQLCIYNLLSLAVMEVKAVSLFCCCILLKLCTVVLMDCLGECSFIVTDFMNAFTHTCTFVQTHSQRTLEIVKK